MSVNVRGVFLRYQHAARQMIAQGRGGRIIGASSMAGKQGAAHFSCNSESKSVVRGLTQATGAWLCASYDGAGIVESPTTDSFSRKAGIAPQIIYNRPPRLPSGKNCLQEDVVCGGVVLGVGGGILCN
ncbi:hypothetical protein FB451DRAFT_1396265 [Mycena latifolia]|nr:hypothetical protein FB451DRAFT_1396265 [Mycena latifolia]